MTQEKHVLRSDTSSKYYLVASIGLVLAGVGLFYLTEHQFSLLIRTIGLIAVCTVALGVFGISEAGKRSVGFIGGARTEVRKVIWPNRQETIQLSSVVLIAVVIVGLFLWGVDSLFLWLIESLIE